MLKGANEFHTLLVCSSIHLLVCAHLFFVLFFLIKKIDFAKKNHAFVVLFEKTKTKNKNKQTHKQKTNQKKKPNKQTNKPKTRVFVYTLQTKTNNILTSMPVMPPIFYT